MEKSIKVEKWSKDTPPTFQDLEDLVKGEGLEPDVWGNEADYQYPIHNHNYTKIIYCVRGWVDFLFPQERRTIRLEPGDKMTVPVGTDHGAIVGENGVTCIEGHKYE